MKYTDFTTLEELQKAKLNKSSVVCVETIQTVTGEIYRVWSWPTGMMSL